MNEIHFTWLQWLTLVVAVVLPLITALVTGEKTHPGIKAVVLVVLSAATGFGSTWLAAVQTGKTFDVQGAIVTAAAALLVGISTHFGIWKPATLSGILQGVGPTLFASSPDGTPAITSVGAHAASTPVEVVAPQKTPAPAVVEEEPVKTVPPAPAMPTA